jgi:hypothetical protein
MIQTCDHKKECVKSKLIEEKTKAGTIFRCKKCGCVYRLMVAVNDKVCWNIRFPVKPMEKKVKVVKEKKKRDKTC